MYSRRSASSGTPAESRSKKIRAAYMCKIRTRAEYVEHAYQPIFAFKKIVSVMCCTSAYKVVCIRRQSASVYDVTYLHCDVMNNVASEGDSFLELFEQVMSFQSSVCEYLHGRYQVARH